MDYIQIIIWAHQIYVGMQCLERKKIELELISDPVMYIFFEKGTRGGIYYNSSLIDIGKWTINI